MAGTSPAMTVSKFSQMRCALVLDSGFARFGAPRNDGAKTLRHYFGLENAALSFGPVSGLCLMTPAQPAS